MTLSTLSSTLLLTIALGLAGCSKKSDPAPAPSPDPGSAAVGSAAVGSGSAGSAAAPSPDPGPGSAVGSAAPGSGSAGSAGSAAAPATDSPRIRCDAEIEIQCADGFDDGCTGGRTKFHVCVAKDAKAGSACPTEIVFTCPAGQYDGCEATPPYGDNHMCVVR